MNAARTRDAELAQRAERADTLIATVCCIGLAFIVLLQLAEQVMP